MARLWSKDRATAEGPESPTSRKHRKTRSSYILKPFTSYQKAVEPLSPTRTTAGIARTPRDGPEPRRQLYIEHLFGVRAQHRPQPSSQSQLQRPRVVSESQTASQSQPQGTLPSIRSLRNKFSISLRPGLAHPQAPVAAPAPSKRGHMRQVSDSTKRYLPWASTVERESVYFPAVADTSATLGSRPLSGRSSTSQLRLQAASPAFVFPLPPAVELGDLGETCQRGSETDRPQVSGTVPSFSAASTGKTTSEEAERLEDETRHRGTLGLPHLAALTVDGVDKIVAEDDLQSPFTFGLPSASVHAAEYPLHRKDESLSDAQDLLQIVEDREGPGWWSASTNTNPHTPSTFGPGDKSGLHTPTRAAREDDSRIELLEKLAALSVCKTSLRDKGASSSFPSSAVTPVRSDSEQHRDVSYGSSRVSLETSPVARQTAVPLQQQRFSKPVRPALASRNSWTPGQSRDSRRFTELPYLARQSTQGSPVASSTARQSTVISDSISPGFASRAPWTRRNDDSDSLWSGGGGGTSTIPSSRQLVTPHARAGSVISATSFGTGQTKHALEKDVLIKALMLARSKAETLQSENAELRELLAERLMENEGQRLEMKVLREELQTLRRDAERLPTQTTAEPRCKHSSICSSVFACPPPDDMSMLVNAKMDIDNVFSSTPAPLQRFLRQPAFAPGHSPSTKTKAAHKVPIEGTRLTRKASARSMTTDISNILSFAETSLGSGDEAGDVSWVLKLRDDDEVFLDDL